MTEQNSERTASRPYVAAAALFFDEDGRILCVRPSYKAHWDIPGGYVENGEPPRSACMREVREELGIGPPPGHLLAVDWAPHPQEGDKLLFVFDGGVLAASERDRIRLDGEEVIEYAFIDLDRADDLLIPRLVRRIRSAARARSTQRSRYLEHGEALG